MEKKIVSKLKNHLKNSKPKDKHPQPLQKRQIFDLAARRYEVNVANKSPLYGFAAKMRKTRFATKTGSYSAIGVDKRAV